MDAQALAIRARQLLPGADQVRVEELINGQCPFKIVVTHGGDTVWYPFNAEDLPLAARLCATKLSLGMKS